MAEQHSSKGIMWATIVASLVLTAIVVPFSLRQYSSPADAAATTDAADARIQPVARIALVKAEAAGAGAPKDAATVYNSVCGACHNTGAAGAPKIDDKGVWAARIAQGKESLYKSALAGKGAMPPKGGAASLSDDEIKATVDYILGKVK